jgi:hypothetical protein
MGVTKVALFFVIFATIALADLSGLVDNLSGAGGDANDADDNNAREYRDVCIIGGGAAGSSAAVFLRDRNYSVIVVEKESNLGGHCDTVPLPQGPPPFNWVDIGVSFWPNTSKLNDLQVGPWDVDSAAFVQRFSVYGAAAAFPVDLSAGQTPGYQFNFNTGEFGGGVPKFPPVNPSADYLDAFNRYHSIVNNTYHWLSLNEYPTNWFPDRVPNDLLKPFSQWITDNNLVALLPVFQAFLNPSGIGSWDTTPALWCVLAVPPSILQSIKVPNTGFIVFGGCQTIYDGIYAFLGANNVRLNSVVTNAKRKLNTGTGKGVRIDVQNTVTSDMSRYVCNKLIIAHPQTTTNLNYANLDLVEQLVFNQVRTRYYFNGLATVNGGILADLPAIGSNPAMPNFLPFNIRNFNSANTFSQPSFPGFITVARNIPGLPASLLGSSDTPMNNTAFAALAATQLARLKTPVRYLDAAVSFTNLHEYQPYPITDGINHPFGFYTQLRAIQGHRNTYYVGALASYAGSYLVWEQAYDLIKHEFA